MTVDGLLEGDGLHDVGMDRRARGDGVDAVLEPLLVGVHDQVEAQPCGGGVTERDHVPELPGRVHVQERERHAGGAERLDRQMQQDARILADRIQDHRPLELGRGFAQDVDRFGFQPRQMRAEAAAPLALPRRCRGFCLRHGMAHGSCVGMQLRVGRTTESGSAGRGSRNPALDALVITMCARPINRLAAGRTERLPRALA